MGVSGLWRILEPVKQHKSLADLRGQVIAVDLSIWIVEAKSVLPPSVTKPHLRNLFFRVLHLLQLGVIPVIVVEGVPPDLKQEVMRKRLKHQDRNGPSGGLPKKIGRTRFQAVHRECCEMLEMLGVPFIQAASEAEAMCAFLNRHRIVDGCITNDGDAFLYGARTVYRNFTMNAKDRHVDMYSMDDVETTLDLDRESLVGLAVLLGCDYLPKGVAGVGREMALRFITNLNGESMLQRFNLWKTGGDGKLPASVTEKPGEGTICRRALASPGFPYKEVVDEFLVDKDKVPREQRLIWERPKLFKLVNYAVDRLDWPQEYTFSKVLPLLTLFDMDAVIRSGIPSSQILSPFRIVKMRIRQGVSCFEVEWHKIDGDQVTTSEYYTTVEEQGMFRMAFPEVVAAFEGGRKNRAQDRKQKTAKQKPSSPESDDIFKLTNGFQNLLTLEEPKRKEVKQRHRKQLPTCLPGKMSPPHRLPKNISTEACSEFNHLVKSSLRKSKSMASINEKSVCKREKPPRFVISSDSSDDDCYWFDKSLDIRSLQEENKIAPTSDAASKVLTDVADSGTVSTIRQKQELLEVGGLSGDDSDSSLECHLPLGLRLALQHQVVINEKSKPGKGAEHDSGMSGKTRCTTSDEPYQNRHIPAPDKVCISRYAKKLEGNDDQKIFKHMTGLPLNSSDHSDSSDDLEKLDWLPDFSLRKSGETESSGLKLCQLLNSSTTKLCHLHSEKFFENSTNSSDFSEKKVRYLGSVECKLELHPSCDTGSYWERETGCSDQNQDKNVHDNSQSEDQLLARALVCETASLPKVCPWNVSQYGNFAIETSILNDLDASRSVMTRECELNKKTECDDSQVDLFDCHMDCATTTWVDESSTSEDVFIDVTSSPTMQPSKGGCNIEALSCHQRDEVRSSRVYTPSVVTVSLAERLRSKFRNGSEVEILGHLAATRRDSSV